jgi:hypothetical protein
MSVIIIDPKYRTLPEYLMLKQQGVNQHNLASFNYSLCVFDNFAIKWSTKCASSTISKIHWHLIKKPDKYPTNSWADHYKYVKDFPLKKQKIYTSDIPLYAFYRDPVKRFISASNYMMSRVIENHPSWKPPDTIKLMIDFAVYHNFIATSDIFWPQTTYLVKPEIYTSIFPTSYLNTFFKNRGINVDQYGSEKLNSTPTYYHIDNLTPEDVSRIKDLYHLDYAMGWYNNALEYAYRNAG